VAVGGAHAPAQNTAKFGIYVTANLGGLPAKVRMRARVRQEKVAKHVDLLELSLTGFFMLRFSTVQYLAYFTS